MKIKFVSLISTDNRPLYIQQFPIPDDEFNEILKYNFLSHMALDVFESSFTSNTNAKSTLLFINDGIHVFGMEMLTGLKVVIGCSKNNGVDEKDIELTPTMNSIKVEYVKFASNPFFKLGPNEEITNTKFDLKIKDIVNRYNNNNNDAV